jgi:non-specific serine/threonine protein kinase
LNQTNARRKDWLRDIHIKLGSRQLVPDLHFVRKSDGVYYQMQLNNGEFTWRLSNRTVAVITNHPAWIIINRTLYKIANINGNMVKPFTKKDEVFIRKSFVKEYFQ